MHELEQLDVTPRQFVANPTRGRTAADQAVAFIDAFPIGSKLTPDRFDEWASDHGYLSVPVDVPKQSDTWKAHLQRRNELRYRINKAGTHPRMLESNQPTFTCDAVHPGLWEVRAPHVAIGDGRMLQRLQTLLGTKRRQLTWLIEGADWTKLPTYERVIAEALYDDIDMFVEGNAYKVRKLDEKFMKLLTRLRQQVEAGALPNTPGMQQMLALESNAGEFTPEED